MTLIAAYSQEQAESVRGCHSCPLARHLDGHRFACADRNVATSSKHIATDECHQAISESPHKYFQPLPLPDLQNIDPEIVCDHINLAVNWLDPDEDQTPDGENLIEVRFDGHKVGGIYKDGNWYACDRITGVAFTDPHYLALHLIHPDFLYEIANEIKEKQTRLPEGILSTQGFCEYM